jgi:SAM-dependent methyltransferase
MGPILEIGSGIGLLKEVVPEAVTSELNLSPRVDRQENAYGVSFAEDSLSNLILCDVWHHLEFPGSALQEFHRVLAPGGRLILYEPSIGVLGGIIYSLFHPEPIGSDLEISWFKPSQADAAALEPFACQSLADRIFLHRQFDEHLDQWELIEVRRFSALAYFASGGFSGPTLCPGVAFPWLRSLDRFLDRWPRFSAGRILVVLEKPRPT